MPQGSSSRGTQRASSARKSASAIAVSWWSVPISAGASRRPRARSSSTSPWPGKPIVNVVGGAAALLAIAATTAAESTPPERKAP